MEFDEILPKDFSSFTPGKIATYIQIEQRLQDIGGGGQKGMEYKQTVLKQAGWKYDRLTGYAKNPELAAQAFNRVRAAMRSCEDRDVLLEKIIALAA
ncbi:MAG: hypothetical protein OEW58_10045 [Gammaproteobacteria bacterium]|nr:hypothetical protein [Gammaproteobacteria bacterium]